MKGKGGRHDSNVLRLRCDVRRSQTARTVRHRSSGFGGQMTTTTNDENDWGEGEGE